MAVKDKDTDPSTVSTAYEVMSPRWSRINTLLGGTSAMRAAGTLYMPRHEHEGIERYRSRISKAALTNLTELTLESLVGKPFSDPVKILEDTPKSIVDLMDDVDMQGTGLHAFCRALFREALAKSFCHVIVSYPSLTEEERKGRTLADDVVDNRRPYWAIIHPENVIFAFSENVKGEEVLTHVRVRESRMVRNGFTEEEREYIRVYEIGRWELYEKTEIKKKVTWNKVEEGTMDMSFIPLHTFYANRTGLMEGKPPLDDLTFLNIQHWQLDADLFNNITVANFPMLAVSGAHDAEGNVLAIGPNQLLGTRNENGKFYYVEHTGKAIKTGQDTLENIEQHMASYGAEFLRKQPGSQTATAKTLDSAEATSPLQDVTLRFIDFMAEVFKTTGVWLKEEKDTGGIDVLTDFGPEEASDVDLRSLNEARRNRDMSRKAYMVELKRRGVIADDFDVEEDVKEMQREVTIDSPFATGRNVDDSGGANPQKSGAGEGGAEDADTYPGIATPPKKNEDK